MALLIRLGNCMMKCAADVAHIVGEIAREFHVNVHSVSIHSKLTLTHLCAYYTIDIIKTYLPGMVLFKMENPGIFSIMSGTAFYILFRIMKPVRGVWKNRFKWFCMIVFPSLMFLHRESNPYEELAAPLTLILLLLHLTAVFTPFTNDYRKDIGPQVTLSAIGYWLSLLCQDQPTSTALIMFLAGLYIDELQFLYFTNARFRKTWFCFQIFPLYINSLLMLAVLQRASHS
ncbi:hypothetical protein O3M35_003758 [Rhynocoris fuscipes]|uniref:Uncharacterized protein n=1 Tax=Rhynocoris fuscipes TaxID=488301 RepID=A0AAW1CJI8_9HEMI